MSDTYGKMDASIGESCSNAGFDDRFTSPCCYADFEGERDDCPECGAPLVCTVEYEPKAVCTIGARDDD